MNSWLASPDDGRSRRGETLPITSAASLELVTITLSAIANEASVCVYARNIDI